MSEAVICPVCHGVGQVIPGDDDDDDDESTTVVSQPIECHGCQGFGWVEIGRPSESHTQPTPPFNPYMVLFGN